MSEILDQYFLDAALERHELNSPTDIAVQFESSTLNYKELNQKVSILAGCLSAFALEQGLNLNSGLKIAMLLEPRIEVPAVVLAIFKMAGVYIPIDPDYPTSRIESVLLMSSPDIVICSEQTKNLIPQDTPIWNINSTREFPRIDLTIKNRKQAEDPAYLFFTSGTTGAPKGVMGSYSNLEFYLNSAVNRFGMGGGTVMPAIAKFTFSISLFELLCPILAAGTVRVLPREIIVNPKAMTSVLSEISMVHCGPALMRRIVDYVEDNKTPDLMKSLSKLQHVSMGGDLVPVELLNRVLSLFSGSEVFVIYGCSEIACMGTTYQYFPEKLPQETLVGIAFPGVQAIVVNENGEEVVDGEKGEVCFSGDGITLGYLNNDKLTSEKYCQAEGGRFYFTGDVGVKNPEGALKLLGRKDFQIKVNGIRIELAEVDEYLNKALHVDQVISMAFRGGNGDNVIYGFSQEHFSAEQIADIRNYLKLRVPESYHPRAFVKIDKFPTNFNNKIDRKKLPIPSAENLLPESEATPPETDLQRKLLVIWQEVLGLPNLGIDDDLFDFGGTSLSSIDLAQKIERKLRVIVPLNEILLSSTVRKMSETIVRIKSGEKKSGLMQIRSGDGNQKFVFVHDGNGDLIPYYTLSKKLNEHFGVFGVAPLAVGQASIVHLSLSDLTTYYCDQIQKLDLSGGVYLGGLCIGGFLSYCVAAELENRGVEVKGVFLFDSHYVDATPKQRSSSSSREELTQVFRASSAILIVQYLILKIYRSLSYRLFSIFNSVERPFKLTSLKVAKRFKLLRSWPLPLPSVDTTLRYIEKKYKKGASRLKFSGPVFLFRALQSREDLVGKLDLFIDDTPYSYFYEGEYLGWNKIVSQEKLSRLDVNAGHSTILIDNYVGPVAESINKNISRDGETDTKEKLVAINSSIMVETATKVL